MLTLHIAHQARLDIPSKTGVTGRATYEGTVQRLAKLKVFDGPVVERALAELDGPTAPASLGYLHGWHHELYGRSGVGMDGLAPLTYGTIQSWATLTQREPLPHEVAALLTLDNVRRHPPVEVN